MIFYSGNDEYPPALSKTSTSSYSGLENAYTVLFRALGLNIVNYMLGHVGHRKVKEPPKSVVQQNLLLVIIRNIVHVIPVGGAIAIIYFNLSGFYIGASMRNLAALQFAAKLHELFMVASLAKIVLYLVRNELVFERGLPFGALVSGLQTSQLSYLWSIEFWALVTASGFQWWRKVRLSVVIVASVLLAATVGPSSAIAMIPRPGEWPAGRTHIWFNGTHEQLFPSNVSVDGVPHECNNSSLVIGSNNTCPYVGWQNIANLASFYRFDLGPSNSNWPNVDTFRYGSNIGFPTTMQLVGQDVLRSLYLCTKSADECYDSLATTQHAAAANALKTLASFWADSIVLVSTDGNRLGDYNSVRHTFETLQPYVLADCSSYGVVDGADDMRPVTFSSGIPSATGNTVPGWVPQIALEGLVRADLLDVEDETKPRMIFAELPPSQFKDTTLGAIVLDARDRDNLSQTYQTCLVAAGWGKSRVNATGRGWIQDLEKSVTSNGFQSPFEEDYTKNYYFNEFPLQRITIQQAWAEYTNPWLNDLNMTAFSAISSLINNGRSYNVYTGMAGQTGRRDRFNTDGVHEVIIASLIANGLSNIGLNFSLQGNITSFYETRADARPWIVHNRDFFSVDPQESADWVSYEAKSYVNGLSYNSNGLPIKTALAILIAYCIIASVFVLYTCVRRISSSSWDSMGELAALAINSPTAKELYNTCAGVMSMNSYKTLVRVVATGGKEDSEQRTPGHAQLVFGAKREEPSEVKVGLNEVYGALPRTG